MLCENCGKRPAQTFVKAVNGKELHVQLCPECFRALYPEKESTAFSALAGAMREDTVCPVCGTSFAQFRKSGLLGCAGCYQAFREALSATVRGMQGKLYHTGKRPEQQTEEGYDRMRAYVTRREALREQLERAVREHDFAAARKLEKALRTLSEEEA